MNRPLLCAHLPVPVLPRRVRGLGLALASVVLLAATLRGEPAAAPPRSGASATAKPAPVRQCLREGTQIVDQWGHFKTIGERWVFVGERDGVQWTALENRNLERVARSAAGNPRRLRWKVTGTVTEYQGSNFLLIERAILKSEPLQHAEGAD